MSEPSRFAQLDGELLTPTEVARLFGVSPKTVTTWAQVGKLPYIRTLGGHRRFPKKVILSLLRRSARKP